MNYSPSSYPREITYYTCTAIMFAFSLKMLWEAWTMAEDEIEETQKEVEQELAELDGTSGQVIGAGAGAGAGVIPDSSRERRG